MTSRRQWGLVLAVVAMLAIGVFAATRTLGDELFLVTVGSAAPDFSAQLVRPAEPVTDSLRTGPLMPTRTPPITRSLADFRGEVLLLNVWATWCLPCREEMPAIQRLHAAFEREGLKVVAVSLDAPGEAPAIRDFAREYGLTFEMLHDPSKEIQRKYQMAAVPETFIIDREGLIRRKVIGAAPWDSEVNRALVAQLLAERGR